MTPRAVFMSTFVDSVLTLTLIPNAFDILILIYVSYVQWRSQNAKNAMHIKGRLLDQPMILFDCVPFQNGNFSYRKEFAPRGREQIISFKNSSL